LYRTGLATGAGRRYTPAVMARTFAFLFVMALPAAGLAQGKLDQVREAMDRPAPAAGDSGSSSSSSDDGPLTDLVGGFFAQVLGLARASPDDPDAGRTPEIRFTSFPYADPGTHYVVLDRPSGGGPSYYDLKDSQWWSVRAAAEAGSNFDGLGRVGLQLFLDTNTRFGLKSDWDWYTERRPCGCRDEMWLGDLTATYRVVQDEGVMMNLGLGARFLVDHGNDHAGVNFLYGWDFFPVKPVHLFGSCEAGIFENAGLLRVRGGVGVNWSHAELFAGYDFVRLGGVNLQGPMVGLRVWF
jgi:hypothetical protein